MNALLEHQVIQTFKPGEKIECTMKKSDILQLWRESILRQDSVDVFQPQDNICPLPDGFSGSRFGHDEIRICGRKSFIESMLILLKEFLPLESSQDTRLELSLHKLKDDYVNPPHYNGGHWVLYIRVFERREGETVLSEW